MTPALTQSAKVIASLALTLFAAPLAAEPPAKATLSGRVTDQSGAAIPRALVKIEFAGRPVTTAIATETGDFRFSLPPGLYSVTVAADGFAPATRAFDLAETSGSLVVQLQVETHTEIVTVTEGRGYAVPLTTSATKTPTPLIDVPQSISIVTRELMRDQLMMSIGDVVRYVPGIVAVQGENNRDQVVIRGNNSTADFFVNGVRDDSQYLRDIYNSERIEALKGPNAMIFGRGGGGGVINRVTKEAAFGSFREITLQGGSFGNRRFTTDLNQAMGDRFALRLNGLYENSDSFRRFVGLERYAVNPTLTWAVAEQTRITLGYEFFRDKRVADRGIPSQNRLPSPVDIRTYFGNPADSRVRAGVNLGSASIEHQAGHLNIRNRTVAADYDRFYQNYLSGAVNPAATLVAITAYNGASVRRNVFNQTDVTYTASTGPIRHTLLWGAEYGHQATQNARHTGYFNNNATTFQAPFSSPLIDTAAVFRQSATDANNQVRTGVAATYLQDQIQISRYFQVVAGFRFDHFDLKFHNNRVPENLRRIDNLAAPRAGVIFKPAAAVSLYGNFSVSYLPSAGDQFSALTTVTQQMKPEQFRNYEVGLKWDLRRSLSLTTAVYRLDRTNTRATDPNDPTRILQTGSQRTNGVEFGLNGTVLPKWTVSGGYAYQDAFIASATTAARAGAQVAQVPHHTFSFWNSYQVLRRLSAGAGILNRTEMFAGVDNTVILPGYTRADAAIYYSLTERLRLQANVENLFDRRYYINADGNNNISPGFPRAVRVALVARF